GPNGIEFDKPQDDRASRLSRLLCAFSSLHNTDRGFSRVAAVKKILADRQDHVIHVKIKFARAMRRKRNFDRQHVVGIGVKKILVRAGFSDAGDDPEPWPQQNTSASNVDALEPASPPCRQLLDVVAADLGAISALPPLSQTLT